MRKFIMSNIIFKKSICLLVALSLFMPIAFLNTADSFAAQIQTSDWTKKDVARAQEAGIVTGSGDFRQPITRGEFAETALKFLLFQSDMQQPALSGIYNYYMQIHPEQKAKAFSDVSGSSAPANIARGLNIVTGYEDETYRSEEPITRQEAAVMLDRVYRFYAKDSASSLPSVTPASASPGSSSANGNSSDTMDQTGTNGLSVKSTISSAAENYTDAAKIGSWAADSINRMALWDVMHGMGDGSFSPQSTYTKEQCYVTFMRLYDNAPVSRSRANAIPLLTAEEYAGFKESADISRLTDCVVGLLSNGKSGSRAVLYDTDTWQSTDLLDLPEVTNDNYAAVTSDGKYIAYTTWSEAYTRRYLRVYSAKTGKTTSYFEDMPARNEIIKISWLPDNHTLVYLRNDESYGPSYMEIQTLDILTGEVKTLVKGEIWRIRTVPEDVPEEGFYLKGEERYLPVQEIRTEKFKNNRTGEEQEVEWAYFLTEKDVDKIYQTYGGKGSVDIQRIIGDLYVDISAPRCSPDGKKLTYSASLRTTAAYGSETPLWIASSIWEYDLETGKSQRIYLQNDGGCIGRVDWIDGDVLSFVTYYEYQGSRDSICTFNRKTGKSSVIFPYTDEHYNNVTLLPVNSSQVTFTSSKKDASFAESETLIYDFRTGKTTEFPIQYDGKNVLLELFYYVKMDGKH